MAQVGIQTQSLGPSPPLPPPPSSAMAVKKSSSSLGASSAITAHHTAYSTSELVERISNLRLVHENHEQEIQAVQQQQTVELNNLKSSLRNAQEMYEKMLLEREVLVQRVRQLEAHHASTAITPQPTAFPQGIPSSRAVSFVQTVLGIHYEPLGVAQLNLERARPVRLSALQKEKSLVADDSASEKEPRRSSKRNKLPPGYNTWKKQSASHPDSQMTLDNERMDDDEGFGEERQDDSRFVEEDELTIPLVAKSGTRIRLKPPKGASGGGGVGLGGGADDDEDASVDLSVHDGTYGGKAATMTTTSATRAGAKRARSPTSSAQGPAKPTKKRNTASSVARNKINIPVIPRDPDGMPQLPMQVGMFTLLSLGEIRTADDLATSKALYPIGYRCERRWFSTIDPKVLVRYTCCIEAGKDPQHPLFRVIPADAPAERGHSATAAWWNIYKEGLRVRNQPEQAVMNGDEMFGLHDNVIKALLQELPGADQVPLYVWRTFVEGGPNTKRRSTAHTVYHIEAPTTTVEGSPTTTALGSGHLQSNSGQMEYDSPPATSPVSNVRVGGYADG
ncbi:hypothetical protein FRC18_010785 [Serendipita sp. 400]|nr:hypothetical protein FRC18_010785 [Serendipita sp. 400]